MGSEVFDTIYEIKGILDRKLRVEISKGFEPRVKGNTQIVSRSIIERDDDRSLWVLGRPYNLGGTGFIIFS